MRRRQYPARRKGFDGARDDLGELPDLLGGALEVVRRQQPEGDDLDPDFVAPSEELADLVGPLAMPEGGRLAEFASPAAIAVEHDAYVPGQSCGAELSHEATLVELVQECRCGQ